MRLKPQEIQAIKAATKEHTATGTKVYLFGSRVKNNAKGGDIDILLLSKKRLSFRERSSVRRDFIKKFGDQRLDIVNYTFDDDRAFKKLIMLNAVKL